MPSISQIIEYVQSIGAPIQQPLGLLDVPIFGIAHPARAEAGDMAWTNFANGRFRGSLLFCKETIIGGNCILCDAPKLAFIAAAWQFFPELMQTDWPAKSQVHPTAILHSTFGLVYGVAIGSNVEIGKNVVVGPNTSIANAVISDNVSIGANCAIGLDGFGFAIAKDGRRYRFPHIGKVMIEENVEIDCGVCIDRGTLGDTVLKSGVKIDNNCHVAHDVILGENVALGPGVTFGGHAVIGRNTWVGLGSNIKEHVVVGEGALIGMGSNVVKDVPDGKVVAGNPARIVRDRNGDDL